MNRQYSSTEIEQEPQPSTKGRKRSKHIVDEDGAMTEGEQKRQMGLQRNRLAASKCRLKKKDQDDDLSRRKTLLETQNQDLKGEKEGLVADLRTLRNIIANVALAGCDSLAPVANDLARWESYGSDPTNTPEINALKEKLTGKDRDLFMKKKAAAKPSLPMRELSQGRLGKKCRTSGEGVENQVDVEGDKHMVEAYDAEGDVSEA